MKKMILLSTALSLAASAAMAADMGYPAKAPYRADFVSPVYNWSGFYAGLHAGYAAGDVSVTDINGGVNPGPFGYDTNGGIVGGQAGYNWQIGNLVTGIEADLSYLGNSGAGVIGSANVASHQDLTLGSGLLADVTGRIGYSLGSTLLYAKGGYAYFGGSAQQQTTNPGYVPTGTGGWSGWTVGAGGEYQLTGNIVLKAEYLHFGLGSRGGYQTNVGDFSSPIPYQFRNSTDLKFDTFKVGASYRFGSL